MRQVPENQGISNVKQFYIYKHQQRQKITMVTCYDYTLAKVVAASDVDCVLVGDSAAMVMHGYSTTVNATVDLIATHTAAVVKAIKNKFIIADLPFLSYRQGLATAMQAVQQLMQAGANAVKLEGAAGNLELISHIVDSGVPVMGHLGLTPQSVHQLGGFKVQGTTAAAAKLIKQQALSLQQAGCFAVVLECVPQILAAEITAELEIVTIGIGAGMDVDGQVLVLSDLLGLTTDLQPKFVKKFADGFALFKQALNNYNAEVKHGDYPTADYSYE